MHINILHEISLYCIIKAELEKKKKTTHHPLPFFLSFYRANYCTSRVCPPHDVFRLLLFVYILIHKNIFVLNFKKLYKWYPICTYLCILFLSSLNTMFCIQLDTRPNWFNCSEYPTVQIYQKLGLCTIKIL